MSSCGRCLSRQEVDRLAARGGDAQECSICKCDMEPSDFDPNGVAGLEKDEAPVFLLRCEHVYHTACLRQWFNQRKRCPQYQKELGKVIGDGPRHGTLEWNRENFVLPGHVDSKQTTVIQSDFLLGVFGESGEPQAETWRIACTCTVETFLETHSPDRPGIISRV